MFLFQAIVCRIWFCRPLCVRVQRADGARACSVNGSRIHSNVWQQINQGDVISFGGAAEVGKNGQAVPNPFLYVVAQHPPMHAQHSAGTAIDLTTSDRLDGDDSGRHDSSLQVLCADLAQLSRALPEWAPLCRCWPRISHRLMIADRRSSGQRTPWRNVFRAL